MSPTALSFPSCRKRMGRKGALGDAGCILRCDSGRNLIYRYYEHTYSPYGRFGTRLLLWCTKFVNSCDSISAVKTPCIRNLRGSTNLPESCRGRCRSQPFATKERYGCDRHRPLLHSQILKKSPALTSVSLPAKSHGSSEKFLLLAAIGRGCVSGFIHSAEKSCFFVSACFFRRNPL